MNDINDLLSRIERYREVIISNLIMLAEIPAPLESPTDKKAAYILERLAEYDLWDISPDEAGNIIVASQNRKEKYNVALVAHMDTIHPETIDHTVRIEQDSAVGPGLVDNNLGLAVLLALPYILEDLDFQIDSNLILCFSSSSLGAGDIKGTRFFLDNCTYPIDYGICIEGFPLGRISYHALGTMRKKITITIPEEYDWSRFGTANAILDLNELMNLILEIPIPSRPKTSIVFNSIKAGQPLAGVVQSATLTFDVRSESNEMVEKLEKKIEGLIRELSSKSGAHISSQLLSRRRVGGIDFTHPMVQTLVGILDDLKIPYRMTPSTSDLSAFIDMKIPAITLGLTQCEHYNTETEIMYIEPMYKGLAQLLLFLKKMDKDFNNE